MLLFIADEIKLKEKVKGSKFLNGYRTSIQTAEKDTIMKKNKASAARSTARSFQAWKEIFKNGDQTRMMQKTKFLSKTRSE